MLAQVQQIIFWERTPCKKLADLHPWQGNLLQRNNFSAVSGLQNLSSLCKIRERPAEKNVPFSTCFFYKVAIYKYLTNEFVYKNEGVGAMAEQSDQIRKIFTHIFW
jgi:hypothetical protein